MFPFDNVIKSKWIFQNVIDGESCHADFMRWVINLATVKHILKSGTRKLKSVCAWNSQSLCVINGLQARCNVNHCAKFEPVLCKTAACTSLTTNITDIDNIRRPTQTFLNEDFHTLCQNITCRRRGYTQFHYIDVIMTTMASQITSLTVVYSTVYLDADQRKHQSSWSLAFVWGIHRDRWIPGTKGQLRGKMYPFDDVIKFLQ